MIPRHTISYLTSWKSKAERKPLVIRGARQVGKTTLVKSFAETYDQFLYFNIDLAEDRSIFEPSYLNMFWTRETSSDAEVDFLIEYLNMFSARRSQIRQSR